MKTYNSKKSNHFFVVNNLMKVNLLLFILFLFVGNIFAQTANSQNTITMPKMPTMPSVTTPSIGSPYYTPGKQTQNSKNNTTQSSDNNSSTPSNENTETNTTVDNNQNTVATEKKANTNQLLQQSFVSAADLTTLSNAGLLNNVYSLFGNQNTAPTLQNQINANQSSTNVLLEQVLKELSDLKKQNSEVVKNASEVSNSQSMLRANTTDPTILRFIVNGYDVLSSCKTIYFSNISDDGTFLLTADRKYIANSKTRSETFYIMFKTSGSSGFSTQYIVETDVVQDYANESSFFYQLAQRQNITASKTGNLITMRIVEQNYKVDLLIDIGSSR